MEGIVALLARATKDNSMQVFQAWENRKQKPQQCPRLISARDVFLHLASDEGSGGLGHGTPKVELFLRISDALDAHANVKARQMYLQLGAQFPVPRDDVVCKCSLIWHAGAFRSVPIFALYSFR